MVLDLERSPLINMKAESWTSLSVGDSRGLSHCGVERWVITLPG